jgi:hypothetical protein
VMQFLLWEDGDKIDIFRSHSNFLSYSWCWIW